MEQLIRHLYIHLRCDQPEATHYWDQCYIAFLDPKAAPLKGIWIGILRSAARANPKAFILDVCKDIESNISQKEEHGNIKRVYHEGTDVLKELQIYHGKEREWIHLATQS